MALDGSRSSDPDGRIVRWQWTVDGAALPLTGGAKGNVTLGAGTSKIVRLTVTDDSGLSASASQTLSLSNRAPTIGAYTPNGSVVSGTQPTLTASGSDPDADSLTYSFHVTGPSVDLTSGSSGPSWTLPAHKLDPGTTYSWDVTVKDPAGASARRTGTFTVAMLPTSADVTATSSGKGY